MKERTWLGILLSFAAPCRGKMAASVVLAILSVAGGFVPYLGVYQIIRLFLERQASWEGILFWCGVCLAGYAIKVAGYALSTMLAHVSAYTILEGLRLQAADRLMGAPLGEVDSRPIGAMKSTIVDRIEDIEPPLAHMIPDPAAPGGGYRHVCHRLADGAGPAGDHPRGTDSHGIWAADL